MNKYSSKAVKTAATVGMSLAMVLSNAAPVLSNLTVAYAADLASDKQTAEKAHDVVSNVLDALNTDYTEAYGDTTVLDEATVKINDSVNLTVSDGKLSGLGTATLSASLAGSKFENGATLLDIATFLANNSSYMDDADIDEDVVAFAKFIKGYAKATGAGKLGDYFTSGNLNTTDGKGAVITTVAEDGVTKATAKNAEEIYKVIKDNEKYLNAMIDDDHRDAVTDTINNFKSEVEDYKSEREDVYVTDYANELEKVELISGVTVYEAVEKEEAISYKNLSKVEKVLKDIKNDDNDDLSAIADYDDVKDAEEVATLIDGLEAIIEDMKEVKNLLKSTNADVKSYKKDLATKVKNLAKAASDYLADDKEANEIALDKALNAFREADSSALKEFVEGFVAEFYTLTPKQLNSGKYVVRLENADYGRYVETKDVFDLLETSSSTAGLQYVLTTVIDNEESDETYYDVLVNTVTSVEELLKAVTDDIEGLTLNSTLTSAQANKIIKAKKALNQLVDGDKIATEYASALTSKEKKEVLANVELIETLYLKLILNGTVTQSGWVDKGNGDWDYIAEDGSRPSKWVASGANWYYVKNGTMLRNSWIASDAQGTRWYYVDDNGVMVSNTTVNGYTFNSYGVWVK
ncbi:hypothetical protein [Dielma fastidiosa]|uniref:hypothetical protein n=1 Tax=Dielma fastidiosa TaxID=1034346 RepID=UPI0035687DB0